MSTDRSGSALVPFEVQGDYLDLVRHVKELERRVAKRSPLYMAKYIMGRGQRQNGKLWGWNRLHVRASRLLQWVYKTRMSRPWGTTVYLEWCRGSRKSTLYQAWLLCCMLDDVNLTMLLNSDRSENAQQKVNVIREMFEDPYFLDLFGDLKGETRKWKAGEFTLGTRTIKTSDATLIASGLDAAKTGKHFGISLNDDLQSDSNAESDTMNEDVKTEFRMMEALHSGNVGFIKAVGGTRWGFRDLGAELQSQAEEEVRQGLPRSIFISRHAAHPKDKNNRLDKRFATFPEGGLTTDALKRKKFSMKPALFAFNFELRPLAAEEALVKAEWIRHHSRALSDFNRDAVKIYLAVDPAIGKEDVTRKSTSKDADYNAMIVAAVTPEADIFVLETVRRRLTGLQLLDEIVRLNEAYGQLDGVLVETYFQQYKLLSWMKTKASERLTSIKWMKYKMDKRAKATRISGLQPYFQSGKVFWLKNHVELENEVLQYPRSDHDDMFDCLSIILKAMAIGRGSDAQPWFVDEAWKDKGLFVPTASHPTPPSDLAVSVKRAEYEQKQASIQRSSRRFGSMSMRA